MACAAYVDLNPIRAAMAETLKANQYTSVQKRFETLQSKMSRKRKRQATRKRTASRRSGGDQDDTAAAVDSFLAPVAIDERHDPTGPCLHDAGRRASDKGFLPVPTAA